MRIRFESRRRTRSNARQRVTIAFAVAAVFLLSLLGYAAYRTGARGPEAITHCDPIGRARPICGFQNPEDLALLPDERHVIVSEYGGLAARPGVLSLLDLEQETRRVLFQGSQMQGAGPWGAPSCVGAPGADFSPHGIDLGYRSDGSLQLLTVQHGGRESVEFFEMIEEGGQWSASWRGCVLAPEGSSWNDLVATSRGGFLVTHMMTRRDSVFGQAYEFGRARLLGSGGHVVEWDPVAGFRRLAGSEGPMPNGIEISAEGDHVFVGYSIGGELRRIHRSSGTIESQVATYPLDNSSWGRDGRLLVVGTRAGSAEMMACSQLERGVCSTAFSVFAVDPKSLELAPLYDGGPGTPSGAGTAALQLADGGLLIGTFAGDRVVRVSPRAL